MAKRPFEIYALDLLETGDYSDFKLRCNNDVYNLHRSVVCPKSDVLSRALNGNFKEGTNGEINLSEDDQPSVIRMITYMYTLDYIDRNPARDDLNEDLGSHLHELRIGFAEDAQPIQTPEGLQSKLIANARVYALADKYNIGDLKTIAQKKFEHAIKGNPKCTDFIAVVNEVYKTTPDGDLPLRSATARYCAAFTIDLMDNEAFVQAMDGHIGLGAGMLRETASKALLDSSHNKTVKTHATSAICSLDYVIDQRMYYSYRTSSSACQQMENAKADLQRIKEHE